MLSVEQLERLAHYRAGELSAAEALALQAELGSQFADGLALLESLDAAVGELPPSTLEASKVEALVARALGPTRSPRARPWVLLGAAAGLVAAVAVGVLLQRPQTVVTVASGVVVAQGRTLVLGEQVVNPEQVLTAEEGVAEVRLASSGTLLLSPRSELTLQPQPPSQSLRAGSVVVRGEGVLLEVSGHLLRVWGEAVVSREPLEGSFRETKQLTPEDLLNQKRMRVVAAAAVGSLALYVLQGQVRVEPKGGEAFEVHAPQAWAAPGAAARGRAEGDSAPAAAGALPAVEESMQGSDGAFEVHATAGAAPLVGANVVLYRRGEWQAGSGKQLWPVAGVAQTDAAGIAKLPARPGAYVLSLRALGRPVTRKAVLRPAGEAVTRVDVPLEEPVRLEGIALDSRSRRPVAPATVKARLRDMPDEETVSVEVGADGRFIVDRLTWGSWLLEGEAPGLGRAEPMDVELPASSPVTLLFRAGGYVEGRVVLPDGGPAQGASVMLSGGDEAISTEASASGSFSTEAGEGEWDVHAVLEQHVGRARTTVVVRAGGTASAGTIMLGPGAKLSGRITSDGAPVPGALVHVSPHLGAGEIARAAAGPDGRYQVPMAPGNYDIDVEASGYAPDSLPGLRVGLDRETTADFELPGNGSVQGVVIDAAGPVQGLLVVLKAARSPSKQTHVQRLSAEGRFAFLDVRPGMWLATVSREGEVLGAQALTSVEPRKASELTLNLQEAATVKGQLSWHCPGPPQAVQIGFMSYEHRPRGSAYLKLGAGETTFSAALAPGSYMLFASTSDETCRGSLGPAGLLKLEAGKQVSVALKLEKRPAKFEVRVLESDGRPAVGALVTVRTGAKSGDMVGLGRTDAEGAWQADLFREEKVTKPLWVLASRGARSGEVKEVALGSSSVTVRLAQSASLWVKLVGAPPGERTKVGLVTVPSFSWEDQLVTTSSELLVDAVPAGRLHLTVHSGARSGQAEVVTRSGERASVTVKLEESGVVRGRLVDAAGKPVPGWVTLLNAEGEETSEGMAVDGTGRFELPSSAGAYQLRVDADMGPGLPVTVRAAHPTDLVPPRGVNDLKFELLAGSADIEVPGDGTA